QRLARRAVEILHLNPDTGTAAPDACERACYDCLLSFYNQQYHEVLDRRLALPFLLGLLQVEPFTLAEAGGELTWDELEAAAEGAEATVIKELSRRGFPLPEKQHAAVSGEEGPIANADLLYRDRIVVWVQSDLHERDDVRRREEEQERRL